MLITIHKKSKNKQTNKNKETLDWLKLETGEHNLRNAFTPS